MTLLMSAVADRLLKIDLERCDADDILKRHVQQTFREGKYGELRHITCSAQEGCVTLSGVLGSYWLKQMAQTEAQRVPGVSLVCNKIIVSR